MNRTSNQELIGHQVAVVVRSRHKRSFVPIDDVTLYSLFPDPIRKRGRTMVVERVAQIRLSVDSNGRIVGRCVRWWDVDELVRQSGKSDADEFRSAASSALVELRKAVSANSVVPFGIDLPLLADIASDPELALDWESMEWDLFRGLNSQVPFRYDLSDKDRARIVDELPFLDVTDHFRGVVMGSVYRSLLRQLLDQYTEVVGGVKLVPCRWIKRVGGDVTVVARVDSPFSIRFSDPRRAEVRRGAIKVPLRRARRPKRAGRDAVL